MKVTEPILNSERDLLARRLAMFPLPCFSGIAERERADDVWQMLCDLERLTREDGCVAAGWALELAKCLAVPQIVDDGEWLSDIFESYVSAICERSDVLTTESTEAMES